MEPLFTTSNIVFALGIIGTIFGVYKSIRDPQISLDKQQDLDKQEADNKSAVLEERIKSDREQNQKMFMDLGVRLDNAFTLAQNHTHSVDVKVDSLIGSVNSMNLEMTKVITRLETTISERIPNK